MDSMLQHISTKLTTMEQNASNSGDDDEISFDFSTTEDNELFSKVEETALPYKRKVVYNVGQVTPVKKLALPKKAITSPVQQIQEPQHTVVVSANPFDIFGTCVAAQLKALPMDKALVAQAEIQNLLSEHALRNLKSK